jgi:hypothetical protein
METTQVQITRAKALDLYRTYKSHRENQTPMDRECMRAYQLLAKGRLVIKALESIVTAGLNKQGFPKLALVPAKCYAVMRGDGSGRLSHIRHPNAVRAGMISSTMFEWPRGTFHEPLIGDQRWRSQEAEAIVPGCPIHLRPKRGLANYHILFEAEWTKIAPHDPMLLRRIGKADLWLVCAHWDLTEVERGALATRIAVM